jgi:putative membrane-bound dehydrogenase-like protein
VNEGLNATPSEGFIGVQSEWAECWIRRFELWPLGKFTEQWSPEQASTDTGYTETGESILPRRHPWSPQRSLEAWRVDGDYEMQLVAAEPLTCDPVDVVWDASGRMFVAEMRDYPLPPDGGPFLSRIRLLKDRDGDGTMDEAVTWADDLDHVQGMLPMCDGLLVTTRTAILFLKDTDGDDTADERRTLFVSNDPKHNQLQVSSPRWGLDNAVYLNNGLDGKEIYPEADKSAVLDFARRNLRFDPYSEKISAVSGRGQFGAAQDDFGRRFFCSNRNPIMFAVMPLEAVTRVPKLGIGQGYEDIQPPGAPVRPLSLSHTTASAHAGTHTAACGMGIYRGELMPALRGNIFVCEPTAQLVTRNRLVPRGASFTAERVGQEHDFLASGDEWCRPVQIRNGPDGALYICDMYRRFVDHSRFFPEEFSRTNYMRAGFDHGRIWRLVPKGSAPPRINPLPDDSSSLVSLMESDNAWKRIHAQRLLVERGDLGVADSLRGIATGSSKATARAHAMWTLQALGRLDVKQLDALLSDDDAGVVENALLAASGRFQKLTQADSTLVPVFLAHYHPDRRVRFISMALWPGERLATRPFAPVVGMIRDNPEDAWIRRAVMSSEPGRAGELLVKLLENGSLGEDPEPEVAMTFREMAALTAANGDIRNMTEIARLFDSSVGWVELAIVTGFSEGLPRGPLKVHGSLGNLCNDEVHGGGMAPVRNALGEAPRIATDPAAPLSDRQSALPLVAQLGLEQTLEVVARLISPSQPAEIQAAACRTLSRFNREKVADFFFERWSSLGPIPLREAMTLITGNTKTGLLLMERMRAGQINKFLMPPMQRWSYCRSTNPEIRSLATELFGIPDADRASVIADYREALGGRQGDPAEGRKVFEKAACATCHRLGETGVDVGPGIADVRLKLPEALLTDILDPNRMVEERWSSYTVETKNGSRLTGIITAETSAAVVVKLPGGITETVPREQIERLEANGISLMPVGLESAITKEEMVDLIAFLKAH